RVDSLFRPSIPLIDAEAWLTSLWNSDRALFNDVGAALCRLLSIDDRKLPRFENGKLKIRLPDGWRQVSDLSVGYRSMLALVVDISMGTSEKRRQTKEATGIVLLDEIEMHQHPSWKISVVERLRSVFPQLSFLVTTHDPLCLKGLRDREIVVLRRGKRG